MNARWCIAPQPLAIPCLEPDSVALQRTARPVVQQPCMHDQPALAAAHMPALLRPLGCCHSLQVPRRQELESRLHTLPALPQPHLPSLWYDMPARQAVRHVELPAKNMSPFAQSARHHGSRAAGADG